MPVLQIHTSVSRTQFPANFVEDLTNLFQKLINKPIQYVAVHVNDDQNMTFAGTYGPCAIMYINSIGHISKELNESYARELQGFLKEKIGIPLDRQILCCNDFPASNVGLGGHVF